MQLAMPDTAGEHLVDCVLEVTVDGFGRGLFEPLTGQRIDEGLTELFGVENGIHPQSLIAILRGLLALMSVVTRCC